MFIRHSVEVRLEGATVRAGGLCCGLSEEDTASTNLTCGCTPLTEPSCHCDKRAAQKTFPCGVMMLTRVGLIEVIAPHRAADSLCIVTAALHGDSLPCWFVHQ